MGQAISEEGGSGGGGGGKGEVYLAEDSVTIVSFQNSRANNDGRILGILQLLCKLPTLAELSQGVCPFSQVLVGVGEVSLRPDNTNLCTLKPCFPQSAQLSMSGPTLLLTIPDWMIARSLEAVL